MYTNEQSAILVGLTAIEQAPHIFKRITGALNKLRKELENVKFSQTYEIVLPGKVAHPTTTAYALHYKLVFNGGRNNAAWLSSCTCGESISGFHNWVVDDDPFDEAWIHVFSLWDVVLENLESGFGPEFRARIEQLERAARLIGPYV